MSVKISHPPVPNIYQSRIGDLQKLTESKNKLKAYTLAQRITRQQNLGNLEDLYKPILNNQSKQISEVQSTNTKLDESKTELTNILQQLVANGNLTNLASDVIVKKLENLNRGVLSDILKTVSKKPEAIALIHVLSKYPNVVQALKDDNVNNLNGIELKIYNELGALDDRTLTIIADYYSKIEPNIGDVFDTSSTQDLTEQTDVKQIDDDSGITTASSISAISTSPFINYSNSIIYQEQVARIFESIISPNNKNILSNVNGYLNAYYPINDNNTSITESGKSLVIS